jgi:hypothetical protein
LLSRAPLAVFAFALAFALPDRPIRSADLTASGR